MLGARAAASAKQTYTRRDPAERFGYPIVGRYNIHEVPMRLREVTGFGRSNLVDNLQ